MLNRAIDIYHLIQFWAERTPNANAIAAPERLPLSYQMLSQHIEYVGNALHSIGVGSQDTIAIVLPNGPEIAVAFVAVACNAIAAPLNPNYQMSEFEFYLSDLHAKALIVLSGMASPGRDVARRQGIPLIELSPLPEAEAGLFRLSCEKPHFSGHAIGSQPENVALILHTSGTTSKPKRVPLTHANLCSSSHHVCSTLELTTTDRCINIMPLFHIHGLVAALLSSLVAGASVLCTPGFDATEFFKWIEAFHPTWYTAVPTMHQSILIHASSHKEIIAHHPIRMIRSSSSPLPPKVLRELEEVFHAPVIEAYGMTEASHQVCSNLLPPRARKIGSVGVAAGPEVAVLDEDGNLLPTGMVGEVAIQGPNVMSGYEGTARSNKNAFIKGWFRTGDRGYLDTDGYLFLIGRLKEIINRGGEKISPREVDERLLDHPDVVQAVAFAIPHDTLGEEVAAAVVLRKDSQLTPKEMREFVAQRLAPFKVPGQVIIVDEIPKGPTGKIQRLHLAKIFGSNVSRGEQKQKERDFIPPRTPVEAILVEAFSHVLKVEGVSIDDNFFELGGDSILAGKVLSRIQDIFQGELSYLAFFEAPTVIELATLIEKDS